MVMGYAQMPRPMTVLVKGILKLESRVPVKAIMHAATIWPASFTQGGSERTSSATPTAVMQASPASTPTSWPLKTPSVTTGPVQTPAASHMHSTATATSTPTNIATPPMRGTAVLFTRLPPGLSTMPWRMAKRRTTGTSSAVASKATQKETR